MTNTVAAEWIVPVAQASHTGVVQPMVIVLVTAILTLGSTLLVQYLTHEWRIAGDIRLNDHQRRQQTVSQLMGQKSIITQLYVSRFESLIFSDFHEARWRIAGAPTDGLDFQETGRWMHKSEDLVLEIAKANQRLFEILGLVRALFRSTPALEDLVSAVYRFKTPRITPPAKDLDISRLALWRDEAVRELQELVEREYAKPIDDL